MAETAGNAAAAVAAANAMRETTETTVLVFMSGSYAVCSKNEMNPEMTRL
ncbi:hypothetical protein L810_5438 [Burkholderia sp. AU4i]|nr:hypothetical protein L810_5438 [Burkholderia sp. AU4i]